MMASQPSSSAQGFPAWLTAARPFILGGIAGCIATSVVQPIDVVKTRLQLQGEGTKAASSSPIAMARSIVSKEGPKALYTGLSAGYARQIVYGSARLGLFRTFSDLFKRMNDGKPLPVWQKMAAGWGAGALGSFIGNPTELALIRMQADGTLPPAERRNYSGVINALSRIIKEEGVFSLWKGSTPTVYRAIVLNIAMLATADEAKERLAPYLGGETSKANVITSSVISGVAAAVASLPFDLVKTRIQKQKPRADGTLPYKNFFDCAGQIAKKEGLGAFYKGLSTYVVRIAPHAIITLIVLDVFNIAWNKAEAKRKAAKTAEGTR
jgi:solute carrier family 25 (mitochondrial oxoglutarate transporter), member 11